MYTFQYPTNASLEDIDRKLMPMLTMDDPIFAFFPIEETPYHRVFWDQKDDFTGLMYWRGLDGMPRPVPRTGAKRFEMKPGAFGEKSILTETELTERAAFGTWSEVVNVDALVAEEHERLLNRQVNRIRWLLWTLVTMGNIVVLDETGAVADLAAYSPNIATANVVWSTQATATPLADFRAITLLSRGQSAAFNSGAIAMMNRQTANEMFANTNANDLGGKRDQGLASVDGLGPTNRILMREDLPQIVIYEGGYLDDSGTWQMWIPDGVVVIFGQRPNNARLGSFAYTRNAVNGNASSMPYVRTVPYGMSDDQAPPPRLEIHRGFNGGPRVFFPGSIVILNV